MMRVWALRPDGWRVLGAITTTLVTGTTPFAATAATTGDCENPCRTMPYTPSSDNAKQIAAIFMRLKMDEWHPDPIDWAPYVLDDVFYVTETAQLSKEDRVKRLASLKESGAPSTPGDPVVSMRIHDLGDSAVMIARHTPVPRRRSLLQPPGVGVQGRPLAAGKHPADGHPVNGERRRVVIAQDTGQFAPIPGIHHTCRVFLREPSSSW